MDSNIETHDSLIKTIVDKDAVIERKDRQITELLELIMFANSRNAEMSKRLADIIKDVVAKPQNSQLLHALAVCELSSNKYAFLRTQMRSLKRSLKRLRKRSTDREPVIIYQSEYVPNSINVLNKIKEHLPKNKFVAKHNTIQFVENYNKENLLKLIDKVK